MTHMTNSTKEEFLEFTIEDSIIYLKREIEIATLCNDYAAKSTPFIKYGMKVADDDLRDYIDWVSEKILPASKDVNKHIICKYLCA